MDKAKIQKMKDEEKPDYDINKMVSTERFQII